MANEIAELKQQLNEAIQSKGDWKTPYEKLMQAVYKLPVIFAALSRDAFQTDTLHSTPLVSTKDFDGMATVYLFSDIDIATKWMIHYSHYTADKKYGLMGALPKQENDFLNFFQIAAKLGIPNLLLDEGGQMVGMETKRFIEVNSINPNDIKLRISQKELEELQAGGEAPALHFAEIEAIPLIKGK